MEFRILSVFYVFFTCWVLSTNVSATFFSLANAITGGGGGGYGGGGYGGGYGSYANYEMAPPPPPPPKPTLGKMIGDKIDGISSLKSMLFGPLLNIATALLNKGGGPAPAPPPAPAPAPAYGGGGGYSSASSPPSAVASASYMSPYGSSGGYSNVNPVSYVQGKSGPPSYQLADKYRYDTAAASQTYVPTYEIQSPSSAEHYQSQTAQLTQSDSNENLYNVRKPEHNDAPSITNTQTSRQHLSVDSN